MPYVRSLGLGKLEIKYQVEFGFVGAIRKRIRYRIARSGGIVESAIKFFQDELNRLT
jgi:hypothetical protein